MFMLCGGGGLVYVDMEAVKNSCYGFLSGFSYNKLTFLFNRFLWIQGVGFTISDYVIYAKNGQHITSSGWQWTGFEGDANKIIRSGNNLALIAVNNVGSASCYLTFSKQGYSFRAKLHLEYKASKFRWKIEETLVLGDNPQLYEELKQNASWL